MHIRLRIRIRKSSPTHLPQITNRRPCTRETEKPTDPCLPPPIPGAFVDGIRFREWIWVALPQNFVSTISRLIASLPDASEKEGG
ncbi:hypothetical protein KSP39_PZI011515 [Platanthera zijinensis]|uniref:Uncharacterized protein n=1 Tax=Platanthera zijinensis TaxID=2320716 RepID=A0AAP0G5K9_9ASPA